MIVLQPPASLSQLDPAAPSLFLAGSIEMHDAPRWQDQLIAALTDTEVVDLDALAKRLRRWWEDRRAPGRGAISRCTMD